MSSGGNREGLQGDDGLSVSSLAQMAAEGRCVCTRCSSARMKPGGGGPFQQLSLLLVPTQKFGLANGFFSGDLHAAARCLVSMEELLWAVHPTESKTCKREEVTGAHLEMLRTTNLPAGLPHTRSKMPFPGAGYSRGVPPPKSQAPSLAQKSRLPLAVAPERCILTPCWLHQTSF